MLQLMFAELLAVNICLLETGIAHIISTGNYRNMECKVLIAKICTESKADMDTKEKRSCCQPASSLLLGRKKKC